MNAVVPAPTSDTLVRLINGFQVTQAIHVAVTLGVPDRLSSGAATSEELAEVLRVHPGALYRLMRALATVGIFREEVGRRFTLTPLGEGLCVGRPGSRGSWAKLVGSDPFWRSWGEMLHAVTTGTTAFGKVHGCDPWALRAKNAEAGAIFDAAMREGSARLAPLILAAYDFGDARHVVDLGGGNGTLLASILAAYPDLTGTLVDLPHVLAHAEMILGEHGVLDRCELVGESFFDRVPAKADIYIMKHVVHDWDDDEALVILRNCASDMAAGGQLLLIERIVGPRNDGVETAFSDLTMLVNVGGRERMRDEFERLLDRAGFDLTATLALDASQFILKAIPRAAH